MAVNRKTWILIILGAVLLEVCGVVVGWGSFMELVRDIDRGEGVRIQRPTESPAAPEPAVLRIDLDANGRIEIKGKEYALVDLSEVIKKECPEGGFLEIRASEKVPWSQVAPIIRAGVAAGISKLNITALTEE